MRLDSNSEKRREITARVRPVGRGAPAGYLGPDWFPGK